MGGRFAWAITLPSAECLSGGPAPCGGPGWRAGLPSGRAGSTGWAGGHGGRATTGRTRVRLKDMATAERLWSAQLAEAAPQVVAGVPVLEAEHTDGLKLRLGARANG